jgi:hypothetical protein
MIYKFFLLLLLLLNNQAISSDEKENSIPQKIQINVTNKHYDFSTFLRATFKGKRHINEEEKTLTLGISVPAIVNNNKEKAGQSSADKEKHAETGIGREPCVRRSINFSSLSNLELILYSDEDSDCADLFEKSKLKKSKTALLFKDFEWPLERITGINIEIGEIESDENKISKIDFTVKRERPQVNFKKPTLPVRAKTCPSFTFPAAKRLKGNPPE